MQTIKKRGKDKKHKDVREQGRKSSKEFTRYDEANEIRVRERFLMKEDQGVSLLLLCLAYNFFCVMIHGVVMNKDSL
jgi:hypothetical protein